MRLAVWAPDARSVTAAVHDRDLPLERGEGGWWSGPSVDPGTDYAFRVDGGEPLPDPRSAHQPLGVHGPSRAVDHGAFAWAHDHWAVAPWRQAVVYELHVGTFSPAGTFAGAAERLDHLVDLGVTHVELLPVAAFPGRWGWGYDGVDLYAVHEPYGGPDGLRSFVDACHGRGLGVLLDVVYNHLGPSGNHLGRFGPYFTDRYRTPWGDAVNVDGPGSDEVRRFFTDNVRHWARHYRVDGLRLDAVHAIVDTSALHLVEELAATARDLERELARPLVVVAESDRNDPRIVTDPARGGYGCDAQWSDDLHHALHACLTAERAGYYADFGRVGDVTKALRDAYVYDGRYSPFRGRRHGRPVGDLPGERFLGYLQNHDQVGNRARGDRTSHLLAPGLLMVGAALVLTSPFVPMLFQGEEWGAATPFQYFTDHDDAELGQAVSEGRRREFAAFGWEPEEVPDPQDPATFERSRLDWDEVGREPHRALLDWHRRLLALRRARPELAAGRRDRVAVRHDDHERWLVAAREGVAVAANLAGAPRLVPAPEGAWDVALASDPAASLVEGGGELHLPPESVVVLTAASG